MSTSKQQAAPCQQLPNMAPPHPQIQRIGERDMFINMIQGATVEVLVGINEHLRRFVLPCALLSQHSIYFRDQIYHLGMLLPSLKATKKRKLSEVGGEDVPGECTVRTDGADMVMKVESDTEEKEAKEEEEETKYPDCCIRLPDVDPAIFGLFLHYIYKDAYPPNIDALVPPGPCQQYPRLPTVNQPVSKTQNPHSHSTSTEALSTNTPDTSTATHPSTTGSTSTLDTKAAEKAAPPILVKPPPSTSSTPKPPKPPPILTPLTPHPLPPSIQAHLLAHRLSAPFFINYTTIRIHQSIGTFFPLTPPLLHAIWRATATHPHSSPLRRLVLDVLAAYWAHRDMRVRGAFIAGGACAWEAVFEVHGDLRNGFLRGLQGGGKVGRPEDYFVGVGVVGSGYFGRGGKMVREKGGGACAGVGVGEGKEGRAESA